MYSLLFQHAFRKFDAAARALLINSLSWGLQRNERPVDCTTEEIGGGVRGVNRLSAQARLSERSHASDAAMYVRNTGPPGLPLTTLSAS